jgi:hypothetical protein
LKGTPYHPIFGVKFLLALAIFFLASVLVGRSDMARKARENAATWLTALVAMILVLLALSSMLKSIRDRAEHKAVPPPAAVGGDS